MGAVRNLLEMLADLFRGPPCARPGCSWRASWSDVRRLQLVEAFLHHVALEHPDQLEEFHALLDADEKTSAIAARRRIELGVAVIDPDDVGLAHRPDDVEPLEVTSCGLSRRRFGWTMALSEVPPSRRCPACFPATVDADV